MGTAGTPETLLSELAERDWAIVLHANPDGDTIGSALGTKVLIERFGRRCRLLCADPPPPQYAFLSGIETIGKDLPVPRDWGVLFLDCADPMRTGELFESLLGLGPVLNVDHHVSNTRFGDLNLVETAAATGEIIARLFKTANIPFGAAAEPLYTAIVTDTGSFRYSSTTPDTHRIAGMLLEEGIDPGRISSLIYDVPPSTLRLHSQALANMKLEGTLAYTTVTRRMLEECQAEEWETEGLIERLRGIKGIELAALLRETRRNIKGSLRSKGSIDVNRLAALFGGGGHKQAAGFTFDGTIEQAEKALLEAIRVTSDE